MRQEIYERALDDDGLSAPDLERLVRNSNAAEYGIDYGISPGSMLNEGYQAAGFSTIDLPSPQMTFARMPNLEGTAFHRVFTDPTAIRSRFARFDPRLSHLADLNAANVDPLTGAAAVSASQQDDPLANLRAYIAAAGGVLPR